MLPEAGLKLVCSWSLGLATEEWGDVATDDIAAAEDEIAETREETEDVMTLDVI